jgi:hypothetical protein
MFFLKQVATWKDLPFAKWFWHETVTICLLLLPFYVFFMFSLSTCRMLQMVHSFCFMHVPIILLV